MVMAPVIDTGRLVLRRFVPDDLDAFYELGSRPEINDNELGYRFLPEFWGNGLATEAGRASIDFARSVLGLKRLVALVHPENAASARVLGKLGFSIEKQIRFSGLPDVDVNLFVRNL
jgi:RimJ/RimL family protein N-acetyltransferase